MEPVVFWQGLDLMQVCGRIKQIWDDTPTDDKPSSICIDAIGVGAGVVDRLSEMAAQGHFPGTQILGISVSESASVSSNFSRLRDELWWKTRTWFESVAVSMENDIERRNSWLLQGNEEPDPYSKPIGRKTPITDELRDILFSFLPNGKIKLEPKADTKERLGRSPDAADAFVLTFADQDVLLEPDLYRNDRYSRKRSMGQGSAWAS